MRRNILVWSNAILVGSMLVLSACSSTPKHTNTLIFGTNTKVALDISQDPTGSVGFTLGYRRQEAVWMPLLANKGGENVPVEGCLEQDCVVFKGTAGTGGPAGDGAKDTYSVLATLSGQTSGQAGGQSPSVKGGGAIAQVFATGFAARLLAVTGGAALVNTESDPTTASAVAALTTEATSRIKIGEQHIKDILICVQKTDGKIDGTRLTAVVNKAAAADSKKKVFKEALVTKLKAYADRPGAELHEYLNDSSLSLAPLLHDQVKNVCE